LVVFLFLRLYGATPGSLVLVTQPAARRSLAASRRCSSELIALRLRIQ
jgi:hypothetical protein